VTITRFEDLKLWQKARELTKLVYRITSCAAFNNDLRLRNQMRDASVSTMSNITEGFCRNSDKVFRQFLFISKSSAAEIQSQSYVALDQKYVSELAFQELYAQSDQLSRMLSKLITYLSKEKQPNLTQKTQQTQQTR
jgi:four helix bundle protein